MLVAFVNYYLILQEKVPFHSFLHSHAGDFIRYIICISTDTQHPLPSNSLADRAFSIAEIRSSHGILKVFIVSFINLIA